MIKVTFQDQDGIYWAVCERVSRIREGGFLQENVQQDSPGGGPHPWSKTPKGWKIIFVEET